MTFTKDSFVIKKDTSSLSTSPEISVGTQFHAGHETKTTSLFLPADGEGSYSPLPAQCNHKKPIHVS